MAIPFVDLKAQYASIRAEVDEAILRLVASTDFILGEDVRRFEEEFAAYCGARYAVGVDSGTAALELALRALGAGPGGEVIAPANTFIATVLAIWATGARPVLVDIDPDTYNISVPAIAAAITSRTRVIVPVHLFGQPADMDAILELADRRGLAVLADACQAHGSRYKGRRSAILGDASAFSFYPSKNLGGYGDGGIVVTDSPGLADAVRMLRNYGQREKYVHEVKGYNHRLDALQAAVLRVKLPHLDDWNAARRAHARQYGELLARTGLVLPQVADYAEHVFHLYVVRSGQRARLQAHLSAQGIGNGVHYPIPIHLQGACSDLGYKYGDFPVTERYAGEMLSLPMYAELEDRQIREVARQIAALAAQTPGGLGVEAVAREEHLAR